MRRTFTAVLAALMTLAISSPALATSEKGVTTAPVVRNFNPDGSVSGETIGMSRLIRRDSGLRATVGASGLIPGGVYTFWWVVIPEGGAFPDDAFVAQGAAKVIGANGKATTSMSAVAGQESIEGFLIPFQPLDFDLQTAEVHVEIAYHGQAADAGDSLRTWMSDFWTGTACPQAFGLNPGGTAGDINPIGQPHCPVYIVSIHN